MISIVSPVYNSKNCLAKLVEKITINLKNITNIFEIILIDDGSTDGSWEKIVELKKKNKSIKGFKLKKNYGQHYAIYKGIKLATKKIIIVMDCDLQDDPSYIFDLYNCYLKYKKPVIIKHSYEDFKLKDRIVSNLFWLFLSILSFKKFSPNLGNYLLINKQVKDKYLLIESIGYLYGDLISLGTKFISIEKKRSFGIRKKTTYNIFKLLYLAATLVLKYSFIFKYFYMTKNKKISKISIEKKV